MKVMIQAECSDWDHWRKAYNAHTPAKVGFQEDIFVWHEWADPNKVILLVEIPSMEAMQEFIQRPENAKAIAESGVNAESIKVTPLADWRLAAVKESFC